MSSLLCLCGIEGSSTGDSDGVEFSWFYWGTFCPIKCCSILYIKCLAYEKSKPLFDMTILSPNCIFIRKLQHTLIYCWETNPDLLFINMLKGDRTTRLNVHNVQGSQCTPEFEYIAQVLIRSFPLNWLLNIEWATLTSELSQKWNTWVNGTLFPGNQMC